MEAGGFLPADADYGEPGPEEGEESEPSTRLPVHAPRPTPFVGCELCPNLTFNPEWAAAYGVALCACCTGRDHLISKARRAWRGRHDAVQCPPACHPRPPPGARDLQSPRRSD